ncbi:MAG: DNA-directed RNA polymerase subunit A' [Candidatus Micrarchaeota archaeon]|nr:DNA-directed RNA polymerase subunit A' [Candidatus Micrarchaeota archaeon]
MVLHYNPVEDEIKRIKFAIYSPEMIKSIGAARITVPDTYDDDGYPLDEGLMDQHLGVIDPGLRCKTCGAMSRDCPGHFGHINLFRPVVHPLFAKYLHKILSATCNKCYGLVLTKEGKRPKKCPHCKAELEDMKFIRPVSFYLGQKELLPTEIKEWLTFVKNADLKRMGYDSEDARPEWMILTVLLVPPVKIRPSITLESGDKSEDDLTHKLVEIIRVNQKLEANINAGAPQLIIEDLWKLLQYHTITYFDNETAGIPPARHRSGRPLKTIAQRLKGKEGRFRYNLSGKRVNFSARTIISPDPYISLNEVGVPLPIAEELTLPIPVTEWNIDFLKELIKKKDYPMARYVIRKDGVRIKVNDASRDRILESLGVNWIVERQLMEKDIVLFNRQPSLHRVSMMCHLAKILPGKTFRINPLVCPAYNADFDGDEMNLHALQTEESQAEAFELMRVDKQILSPRHGHAIIKMQQDNVSGVYFLTRDDAVLTKEDASHLLIMAGITKLPKPDVDKKYYSGKAVFSMILPEDFSVTYKSKLGEEVVIKDGKLLKGSIESKGITGEIVEKIFLKHGPEYTRWFLDSATRMGLNFLLSVGLSVSMKQYTLDDKSKEEIDKIINNLNRQIDNLIGQYDTKTLERFPGMSMKETVEVTVMGLTSKARDSSGDIVMKSLGKENPSILMALIGARGSMLNVIQMASMVGQQAVRNKRPKRGYSGRLLPFYKPGVLSGRERGFVHSSFMTGLEVDEFFQHAIGGRESIVNKSIRTARSGYMQRRLIHAMQDLSVSEDLTVRDTMDRVIQFVYGGDAKDPMFSTNTEFIESIEEDDVDTASK